MTSAFPSVTRPSVSLALGLALAFGITAGTLVAATAAELGVGDKLKITVFGSPSMSGDYTVQANGALAFPGLGQVKAEGIETADLEARLADGLAARLSSRPSVTIEIVEHRPFFVIGPLRQPGKIAYIDGLTVLQAVALAGGFTGSIGDETRADLDVTRAQESLDVLVKTQRAIAVTRARLVAERDATAAIAFPPDDRGSDAADRANEERLFTTRVSAFADEMRMFDEEVTLLEDEIEALKAQTAATQRQADLIGSQIKDIDSLVSRGIVPRQRLVELQTSMAGVESKIIELGAAVTRNRQAIVQNRLKKGNRQRERVEEVVGKLQESERQIAQNEIRIESARRTLRQTREVMALQPSRLHQNRGVVYEISRRTSGGFERLTADEETAMLPGDILRVSLMPDAEPSPAQTSEPRAALQLPAERR